MWLPHLRAVPRQALQGNYLVGRLVVTAIAPISALEHKQVGVL